MFDGTVAQMRTRVIRNKHGSARAALDKWLAGSLWGNPIQMGPDRFHVYGAWRRRWKIANVEFATDRIVIVTRGGNAESEEVE